jgi:hypothetical protein
LRALALIPAAQRRHYDARILGSAETGPWFRCFEAATGAIIGAFRADTSTHRFAVFLRFPAYSAESSVNLPQTACYYRGQAVYEAVSMGIQDSEIGDDKSILSAGIRARASMPNRLARRACDTSVLNDRKSVDTLIQPFSGTSPIGCCDVFPRKQLILFDLVMHCLLVLQLHS